MARTISEIKNNMCVDFMANETLATYYGFTVGDSFDATFSKVSFEGILFYIVASAIFILESLYDTLKTYVDAALNERSTHGAQWYADLSKAFQFGDAINPKTGKYDVIDESKMVVAFAAAQEINGKIYLKVARILDNELAALSAEQLAAFIEYIEKTKDFGVVVNVITADGDDARFVIDIWYDPLVLNADGSAIDGSGEPVPETVTTHIKNLPFNGEFAILSLEDDLQNTTGVKIPNTLSAESKYAENDWKVIDAKVKPNAGYMVVEMTDPVVSEANGITTVTYGNLTINYRAYDGN